MKQEIKPLTGLRGIAAIIIMAYHFGQPYQALDVHTHYSVAHGYLAVDFFYVLSGFVLAYAYGEAFRLNSGPRQLGMFMLKRIGRLYPAYFVAMLLFLLKMAVNFAGDNPFTAYRPLDIVGNLLMMTGWGLNIVPVVVDSWSVSAELVCYMLFPILVPFAVPGTLLWRFVAAILCFVGLLLVVTLGHGVKGPLDVVMQNSFYPLVRCVCGFTIGLVVFRSWLARATRCFFGRDLTCAVLLVGFLVLALAGAPDLVLYACIAPIVLALASGSTVAAMVCGNTPVVWLGEISYSLYLCHDLLVTISVRLSHILQAHFHFPYWYLLISPLGMIAACLLAWTSFRLVEVPGRRLLLRPFDSSRGREGLR